jgi:hypothetical protein
LQYFFFVFLPSEDSLTINVTHFNIKIPFDLCILHVLCYLFLQELLALGERLGEVRKKGLTSSQINQLPIKTFRCRDDQSSSAPENQVECNVCFCEFENGDSLRILPCFHDFHSDCIDKWIKVGLCGPDGFGVGVGKLVD